jgi:hypothetical protein
MSPTLVTVRVEEKHLQKAIRVRHVGGIVHNCPLALAAQEALSTCQVTACAFGIVNRTVPELPVYYGAVGADVDKVKALVNAFDARRYEEVRAMLPVTLLFASKEYTS